MTYIIDQNWEHFTVEDHTVWNTLYDRQVHALGNRIIPEFIEGLSVFGQDRGVPNLIELNSRLAKCAGWKLVAVPGIVPDDVFFDMLLNKTFPIGNFIRPFDQLDYLNEPDLFHDLFGHVPLLTNPTVGKILNNIGRLGKTHPEQAGRLYWYTMEFGLSQTDDGGLMIFGAGLASSFGEFEQALSSPTVTRRPFTAFDAVLAPYRNNQMQPVYFVNSGIEDLDWQIHWYC